MGYWEALGASNEWYTPKYVFEALNCRFDIEYLAPSIFAGKRVTTFDLWSGSTLPEHLQKRFPDTAKFLGGAEKCSLNGEITTCWNPSDHRTEPYPLPSTIGIK